MFSADEADFALPILEAFGDARFTLSDYFIRLERGKASAAARPGTEPAYARHA
jgi:hypothetical protein